MMIKKMVSYVVGLMILSFFAGGIVSFALEFVPYVLLAIVLIAPFFGIIRIKMNWNTGILFLFKVLKFRKVSITVLLISCIVLMMLFKVMVMKILMAVLFALGGATVICISWESVRYGLNKWKAIQIVSFAQAFKKAW